MMGQVQELADDLVTTSRNNREMLVGMIRAEVDRAVGRMGFVREDELAALRRHVQRLEKQIADLQPPIPTPPRAQAEAQASQPSDAAEHDAPQAGTSHPGTSHADQPKKKKKVVVVDDDGGHA
jgi:hypothetical protein